MYVCGLLCHLTRHKISEIAHNLVELSSK